MICLLKQKNKEEIIEYSENELIQEGFVMIQYSIYVRVCPSREFANRIENRIRKSLPQEGNVRLLCVTEKQYDDMKLLVGSRQTSETAIGTERLIII